MTTITIELPGTPPGEAAIGGAWSRSAVREAIAPWQHGLSDALRGERLPTKVSCAVTLGFADRRKRKIENWEAPLKRLLTDALGEDRLVEVTVKATRRKRAGMRVKLSEAMSSCP